MSDYEEIVALRRRLAELEDMADGRGSFNAAIRGAAKANTAIAEGSLGEQMRARRSTRITTIEPATKETER